MSSILEFRYFNDADTGLLPAAGPPAIVGNDVDLYTAAGALIVSALVISEVAPGRYRVTNPGTETGHVTLHCLAVDGTSLVFPPIDYVLRNDATVHYPTDAKMAADIAASSSTKNITTETTIIESEC